MANKAHGETADELIEAARRSGLVRTRTQLARRHREGLLPRPEQVRLGRGRGSVSVYPSGTTAQFVALCEVERETKKLEPAGFELWWRGYDVDPGLVGHFLSRGALSWDVVVDRIRAAGRSARGQAWLDRLIESSASDRIPVAPLRQARKRVGSGRFPTLIRVILEISSGRFFDYQKDEVTRSRSEEQSLVERGLGIEQARVDAQPGAEPWLQGSSATSLAELSKLVVEHPLVSELEASSSEDLSQARDELRQIIYVLVQVSRVLGREYGRQAFGLHAIGSALERFKPEDRAHFLLFWLMLRRHAPRAFQEGYEAMAAAAVTWEAETEPAMRVYQALQIEIPELATLASPARMLAAQRDPRRMEDWSREVAEVRERHSNELDAFFARHPEFILE